jgi:hypothetical protein
MASTLALRNEMVATIVRGFKILRGIEWANELAEEQLLEARMTYATALAATDLDEWAPSPEEIRAACDALYASWTEEEREQRRRIDYVPQRMKRYVADFHHLQEGRVTNSSLADRSRRYRERHRERLLAQRQDPEWQARRREQLRRYRERNQFLIKERKHARREEINAYQKQWRDEHAEHVNAGQRARWAARRDEINAQRRERRAAKISTAS